MRAGNDSIVLGIVPVNYIYIIYEWIYVYVEIFIYIIYTIYSTLLWWISIWFNNVKKPVIIIYNIAIYY